MIVVTRSLRSLRSDEAIALRAAGGAGSPSAVSFEPAAGEAAYGGRCGRRHEEGIL